ncbi:MAG: hypothetical protein J2O48_09460 [Solirubrobacterales bacterium]|nr:hypothetical protein [Solirubrobacterales bacterium]
MSGYIADPGTAVIALSREAQQLQENPGLRNTKIETTPGDFGDGLLGSLCGGDGICLGGDTLSQQYQQGYHTGAKIGKITTPVLLATGVGGAVKDLAGAALKALLARFGTRESKNIEQSVEELESSGAGGNGAGGDGAGGGDADRSGGSGADTTGGTAAQTAPDWATLKPGDAAPEGPWRRGENIWTRTRNGDPSWTTVRRRYWMNAAQEPDAAARYGEEELARMKQGRPPQRENRRAPGGVESMELSHEPIPKRDGGQELVPRWPCDHAAVDKFRDPGYCD